jgi:6-phosphogluconolactonase (cycloisomerase 2 family)
MNRVIAVLSIILANMVFLGFFIFSGCDYFKLLSRKEWNEKTGVNRDAFLYVLNKSNSIKAYKIRYDQNGALEEVSGSPYSFGASNAVPADFTIDNNNKYLYTFNGFPASVINGFSINDDGNLSSMNHFPVYAPDILAAKNIITNPFSGDISIIDTSGTTYSHDDATGRISRISNDSLGNVCASYGTTVDKKGQFIYMSDINTSTQAEFKILEVSNSGAVKQVGTVPSTGFVADTMGVHSSGKFFYSNDITSATLLIHGYSIDKNNGALTNVSGSPYSLGSGCIYALYVPPYKDYLLVADTVNNHVVKVVINPSDGSFVSYTNYSCSYNPTYIAIDPTSSYLYVGCDNNSGTGLVRIFDLKTFSETGNSPVVNTQLIKRMTVVGK